MTLIAHDDGLDLAVDVDAVGGGNRIATVAAALRTAVEKGRLVIALPSVRELPWLKPSPIPANAKIITDPQESLIASNGEEAVSDTGELTRNWQEGIYKIDTLRTQAAMGWIGGKAITGQSSDGMSPAGTGLLNR